MQKLSLIEHREICCLKNNVSNKRDVSLKFATQMFELNRIKNRLKLVSILDKVKVTNELF